MTASVQYWTKNVNELQWTAFGVEVHDDAARIGQQRGCGSESAYPLRRNFNEKERPASASGPPRYYAGGDSPEAWSDIPRR